MSNAPTQIPLLAEPQSTLDGLRELWSLATEAERREFLEAIRRHYLFGASKVGRQTAPDRQRGVI